MNFTYKTNLYMMPLFEIVEINSTDMTYSVSFVFMIGEKENNFTRALQMLLKLLKSKSDMLKVVVNDRDTTLMNAIPTVIPETSAILSYFLVGRNVREKIIIYCRVKLKVVKVDGKEKLVTEVKPSDIVETIFRAWKNVVESSTQESYASNVMQL